MVTLLISSSVLGNVNVIKKMRRANVVIMSFLLTQFLIIDKSPNKEYDKEKERRTKKRKS